MLKTVAVDPKSRRALHVEEQWNQTKGVTGNEVIPVYMTTAVAHGTFTAAQATGTGTTIVAAPNDEGSLMLTDIFLSSNKVNNAVITLQFNDGTTAIPIVTPTITDAPANFAASLGGRWQGWKDARVELVVTGGTGHNITASVGYIKMPTGLPYTEWDSLR